MDNGFVVGSLYVFHLDSFSQNKVKNLEMGNGSCSDVIYEIYSYWFNKIVESLIFEQNINEMEIFVML